MELIDAKTYVELQYIPVNSVQEATEQLRHYENQPDVDYMDGILYSMNSGVIMIGRLTNEAIPGRTRRFDRAIDPWFYMHAENVLKQSKNEKVECRETIPVQAYLFRYDRGKLRLLSRLSLTPHYARCVLVRVARFQVLCHAL